MWVFFGRRVGGRGGSWRRRCSIKVGENQRKIQPNIIAYTVDIPPKSHRCGELRSGDAGEEVILHGWVQHIRVVGNGLLFGILRDGEGKVQITANGHQQRCAEAYEILKRCSLESVVVARGKVVSRPESQRNPHYSTGDIEIELSEVTVLNRVQRQLPFLPDAGLGSLQNRNEIGKGNPEAMTESTKKEKRTNLGEGDTSVSVSETARFENRYLELRKKRMQQNLRMRSKIFSEARNYLLDQDFVEVETPTLFRASPEGAREFLVPTRRRGEFYSLTQSPQQYKQLLMGSGFDRYFQVARCYRDEEIQGDRQPEFTQLDMELGFVDRKMVMNTVEGLMKHIHKTVLGTPVQGSFPVMTYDYAMRTYGSDKPDCRFGYKLEDVTDTLQETDLSTLWRKSFPLSSISVMSPYQDEAETLELPEYYAHVCCKWDGLGKYLSKKQIRSLVDEVSRRVHMQSPPVSFVHFSTKQLGGPARKYLGDDGADRLVTKLEIDEDDVVFLAGCPNVPWELDRIRNMMGKLRLEVARALEERGYWHRESCMQPIWVVDFPLFELADVKEIHSNDNLRGIGDCKVVKATHHPFTAPHKEDLSLLLQAQSVEELMNIRSQAYDVVVDGVEVGGGSIRNHTPEMQEFIFHLLRIDGGQFPHLMAALGHGTPPHGGLAIGLDRYVAMCCDEESIRNVIAFPKTGTGRDLLVGSPRQVPKAQLDEYFLSVQPE